MSNQTEDPVAELRRIASVINCRPVAGHWPSMMAQADSARVNRAADQLERLPAACPDCWHGVGVDKKPCARCGGVGLLYDGKVLTEIESLKNINRQRLEQIHRLQETVERLQTGQEQQVIP